MAKVHQGGCLCGDPRYGVRRELVRTSVCRCACCRRRTGSAFAVPFLFRVPEIG